MEQEEKETVSRTNAWSSLFDRFVYHPNSFQGELCFDFFIELFIVCKDLIDNVPLIPETDTEKLRRLFSVNAGFEPTPGDEQSVIRLNILHYTDELIERRPVQRGISGLDLYTDTWLSKTHWFRGYQKVDTLVGSLRAHIRRIALRTEDGVHKPRHAVSFETSNDEFRKLISGGLLQVIQSFVLLRVFFISSCNNSGSGT